MESLSELKTRLRSLPSEALLRELKLLVDGKRGLEAELLAHLGEADARKLYLEQACSSMFAYATEVLGFSKYGAYKRITAARLAREYPKILEDVRDGVLHLSSIVLLAPHMKEESPEELLAAARHRSKREVEQLLADRRPKPSVPSSIRRLPVRGGSQDMPLFAVSSVSSPKRDAREEPLGLQRFRTQFTASERTHDKLTEARALLRHQIPAGDMAEIFDRALSLLLVELRRTKLGETKQPRPTRTGQDNPPSRHIPAAIRRAVAARDGGQCTYVDENGRRCSATELLEFHHTKPWARSRRHSADEIVLLCRPHNQQAAVKDYGPDHMRRYKARE